MKSNNKKKSSKVPSAENGTKPYVGRSTVKLKPIEKVAQILGGSVDKFSDGSQSWVLIEDKDWSINICFDDKGDKFEHITIAKKIYQVVDEKVIARIGGV